MTAEIPNTQDSTHADQDEKETLIQKKAELDQQIKHSLFGYLQYWPVILVTLLITMGILGINFETGELAGNNSLWTLPLYFAGFLFLFSVITKPRLQQEKEESWERVERENAEKRLRLAEEQAALLAAKASEGNTQDAAIADAGEEAPPEEVKLEAICPVKPDDVDVLVLWGSETGNAEGLAEVTATQLASGGLKAQAVDMAEVTLPALPDFKKILVLTSTWGDGEPPANAISLHESFQKHSVDLSQTKFSVLSLGDTSYPEFCKCGKDFDEFLAAKGAQRVFDRIDCDLDYQANFDKWLAGVKSALA
ncbi:MAG: flavodoxin domain-containing protein [Cyanobacteria bacterium P01_H01_bin.74]